jgi:hypothetical protein
MEVSYNNVEETGQEIWYTQLMVKVCDWRDGAQDIGEGIIRRVSCGAALVGLACIGLIDAVGSLALAIITSPSFIFGSEVSLDLGKRGLNGIGANAVALTYLQIINIFCDRMGEEKKNRFSLNDLEI